MSQQEDCTQFFTTQQCNESAVGANLLIGMTGAAFIIPFYLDGEPKTSESVASKADFASGLELMLLHGFFLCSLMACDP